VTQDADFEYHIRPEPSDEDRAAVLAALHELLAKEAELLAPAPWRLAGWTEQRVGLGDLQRWVPAHRRWPLSARLPRGGRVFPGLNGRGDAK
jgi:hypothetical protein